MKTLTYAKLEHDLRLGHKLNLARMYSKAAGFLGGAKGTGFTAYLAKHGIPRRQAYRLIARWERISSMLERIKDGEDEFIERLEREYPFRSEELFRQCVDELRAMRDKVVVSND
jgi:fructose-1-phosphate kinase PfkB-like protein